MGATDIEWAEAWGAAQPAYNAQESPFVKNCPAPKPAVLSGDQSRPLRVLLPSSVSLSLFCARQIFLCPSLVIVLWTKRRAWIGGHLFSKILRPTPNQHDVLEWSQHQLRTWVLFQLGLHNWAWTLGSTLSYRGTLGKFSHPLSPIVSLSVWSEP